MKPFRSFLLLAFELFLVGFGLAGLLMGIGAPQWIVTAVMIAVAWTPNIVFVLIHKRLARPISVWQDMARMFAVPLEPARLLLSVLVPVAAAALTALL